MAHHITNRRRSYKPGSSSFFWEGLNASAYVVGAVCFIVGSVFFLPALDAYYAVAAWLFVIGSVIYLAVTLHDFAETLVYYRQNGSRGGKAMLEILTLTGYVVACVLFVLGSIFFLPGVLWQAAGAWCFIVGSVLFAAGAAISVTQVTEAGTLTGMQLLNTVAICFVMGSVLFLIPSIPYVWPPGQPRLPQKVLTYLAGQFIFASVLFLVGGVANFYRAYRMHGHHVVNGQ